MDTNALFKIGYGLYVLTAKEGDKDNGCIVNTVMQLTSNPCMIGVAVNKQNYTCGMIQRTKKINISTGNHMLIVKGTQTVTRELNVPEDCNRVYINLVYSNEITSIRTE